MCSLSSFIDPRNGCTKYCLPHSCLNSRPGDKFCCYPWLVYHDIKSAMHCSLRLALTMINHLTIVFGLSSPCARAVLYSAIAVEVVYFLALFLFEVCMYTRHLVTMVCISFTTSIMNNNNKKIKKTTACYCILIQAGKLLSNL